jgi:hypothetical protein
MRQRRHNDHQQSVAWSSDIHLRAEQVTADWEEANYDEETIDSVGVWTIPGDGKRLSYLRMLEIRLRVQLEHEMHADMHNDSLRRCRRVRSMRYEQFLRLQIIIAADSGGARLLVHRASIAA